MDNIKYKWNWIYGIIIYLYMLCYCVNSVKYCRLAPGLSSVQSYIPPSSDDLPIDDESVDKSARFLQKNSPMSGIYGNPEKTEKNEVIWSGDLVLSAQQIEHVIDNTKRKKTARTDPTLLWPGALIYYQFHQSALGLKDKITAAMEKWSSSTCVGFKNSFGLVTNDVVISSTGLGCFSHMGGKQKSQIISLDAACATDLVILHQLGHIIGLWHAHSRPDRDEYFELHFENIDPAQRERFNITRAPSNTTYDFDSVMHYDFFAFSVNGKMSFVPKDPLIEARMYNSRKPSFQDFKMVNDLYQCDVKICEAINLVCRNGGFLTMSSHKGCRCTCPDGFEGILCDKEYPIVSCSEKYTQEGKITSPNYPEPPPPDLKCVYWIQAPENKKISVDFEKFQLHEKVEDSCLAEYLQIRSEDLLDSNPGKVYCDSELQGENVVSLKQDMVIVLKTSVEKSKAVFSATFKFI